MKNRLIAFLLIVLTLLGAIMLPVSADTKAEYEIATEDDPRHFDGIFGPAFCRHRRMK